MKTLIHVVVLLALSFLLMGCSSISQQEVDQLALDFIKQNVVFYAKNGEETVGFDQYRIAEYESYRKDGDWVAVAHIVAELDGEEKENNIILTFDSSGELIMFNGKPVQG